ncbi:MAG: LysR family transcriptional regulator, partial [Gammaproteobacteria bacterium]|nr:LysR family transcriptional regulator [Gammaproteobacteria bacterium]
MSYSRAAQELFLTQSAVSHQIKLLESSLDTRLFRRAGRAMLLTDNGQRFYTQVKEGLERFVKAVAELRAGANQQTLNISVVPSFASGWLVPRLSDFHHRDPRIDVSLRATTALADFSREDVDLALRSGLGIWRGLKADMLFQTDMFPACSPRYRNGRLPQTARELLSCDLLHI